MAFNVPNAGGMPTEEGIKKELEKKVIEGMGLDDNLIEWSKSEDKDEFEAKLMQVRPQDWKDFWQADGEVNRNYLAEKITTKEKFAMLASHLIGDQLFSLFFPDKDAGSYKTMNMDEATDFFTKRTETGDSKARKAKDHLVWDSSSPFSQLTTLFSLADFAKESSTETQEAFPLVPGTFWLINPGMPVEGGAKIRPTMYSVLQRACERVGIKLNFLKPGEAFDKPGDKEISLSFLPTTSVPLKADGEVDLDLLDWYCDLYKEGPWMLMQGSPLLAAVRMRTRSASEDVNTAVKDALGPDYANMDDANFQASLLTIPAKS